MSIEQITSEVLQLNVKDRAVLAELIWESFEEPYLLPNITDNEAIALAKQRDLEVSQGRVKTLTHNELMNRLRDED
jgi:hypothetical protein